MMASYDPPLRKDGRRPARPNCEVCKQLVARSKCNHCSKKLCHRCAKETGPDIHACPEHVLQMPLALG